MALIVGIVTAVLLTEALGATFAIADCRNQPQHIPARVRRSAVFLAVTAVWIVATVAYASVHIWTIAIVIAANVAGHYLPRLSGVRRLRAMNPRVLGPRR